MTRLSTVFRANLLTDFVMIKSILPFAASASNGEKIELANKPFIKNGGVYVPLEEIIEKGVSKDDGVAAQRLFISRILRR